jgi:glycosyltransferase involved in cell wall biosynthesis
MLYFMGYTSSSGNWTGNFTQAVREGLKSRSIPFQELAPYDWYATNVPINEYMEIESNDDDVWFIGWAQSPLIELIKHKKGRKFGLVVGLTAMPFEPAVLWEAAGDLRERERLGIYDRIFANSEWCKECICTAYPELADRVAVTGFPIDFDIYKPYLSVPKEENLIVFNQRFTIEKLHVIELEVARRLVKRGYRVQHLSGVSQEELANSNPSLIPLLEIARRVGLEFVYNHSKDVYHRNLAKASVVITTSIADMLPSSLIEGIYLGAVPVAPRAFCFQEFVDNENLYQPYDIQEILDIVSEQPVNYHPIDLYSQDIVVGRFLKEMGLK